MGLKEFYRTIVNVNVISFYYLKKIETVIIHSISSFYFVSVI